MNRPRNAKLVPWIFAGALGLGALGASTMNALGAEPAPEGAPGPKGATLPQRDNTRPSESPPAGTPEAPTTTTERPTRADSVAPTEPARSITAPANAGNPTWTAVKLHHINKMEIQAATIEREGGESPRVKAFAANVARDHERAERQLADYARQQKIDLDGTLAGNGDKSDSTTLNEDPDDVQMQATLNQLRKSKGVALDRAFLATTITGHDQTIQMVRDARAATQDRRLTSMLDALLPVLQKHRKAAAMLNNSVAGTSSVDPTGR